MFVTGRGPDDRPGARGDGRSTSSCFPPPAPTTTRISPSPCSARSSRARPGCRTRRTSTSMLLAPLGLARTTWYGAGAPMRSPTWSTSSRAPPGASRTATWAASRRWASSGRRSAILPLGRRSSSRAARVCSIPATVDEMWAPQVMMNPDDWTVGWGLGLELVLHERRVFGGHGGAMPGFLAGLYLNRETKTGAAVLTNAGTRAADAGDRARARFGDARALAARDRAVAARDRPAAGGRRDPRPLVVGGLRVRLRLAGRQADRAPAGRSAADQAVGLRAAARGRLPRRLGPRARRAAPRRGRPADLGRVRLHPQRRSTPDPGRLSGRRRSRTRRRRPRSRG